MSLRDLVLESQLDAHRHDLWRFIVRRQGQNQRDSRTCLPDSTDMSYQGEPGTQGQGARVLAVF